MWPSHFAGTMMNTVEARAAVINDQFTYKCQTSTLTFTLSEDAVYTSQQSKSDFPYYRFIICL